MGKKKKGGNQTEATPKTEAPKVEQPKPETPKVETPKAEPPKAEQPKTEQKGKADQKPKEQKGSKPETPKAETPKEQKTETPKAETPKEQKTETPKASGTQLGAPGTQLGGQKTQSPSQPKEATPSSGGNKKKKGKQAEETPKETPKEAAPKSGSTAPSGGPFKFDFGGSQPAPQSGAQPGFKFDFGGSQPATGGEKKSDQSKGGKKKKGHAKEVIQEIEEEEEDEENAFQDPELLKALSRKMNTLIGKSSGYLESLPRAVQDRIKALKKIHEDKVEIEKEFKKELDELEKKYETKYTPLYQKRCDIVNGKVEPTAEEIGERVAELDSEGKEIKTNKQGADITGIPEFWLQALKHHPDIGSLIEERDEEALKHLIDVKYSSLPEGKLGFALEFYFSPNPFFEETILRKEYHEEETPQGIMYDRAVPAKITWKAGKNLTVKKVTKKKGGRRGGRGGKAAPQSITVEEPTNSFFNFFDPEKIIEMVEVEDEEEGMEQAREILEADYEVGMEIKEKIIPHAVLYFTGEIEFYDDEYEDEEGGDMEEGSYHSEEDEDFKPDPNEKPPECKQQ